MNRVEAEQFAERWKMCLAEAGYPEGPYRCVIEKVDDVYWVCMEWSVVGRGRLVGIPPDEVAWRAGEIAHNGERQICFKHFNTWGASYEDCLADRPLVQDCEA